MVDVARLQRGARLGHYEILSAIGKGGMGEVWKALDATLRREVAIKTLPEESAQDADRLARLEREATLLASLNHPNIAAIYGLEADQGTRFLVLELVEGSTLADRLGRGRIPVGESLKLALQIAEALEAAHEKGVIHRDLKPANIKVTPEGRIKVLDFGLAKALAPGSEDAPTLTAIPTQAGAVIGTPAYMSPEQARGETAGRQSDIWSFGVVLYELLTGASPFRQRSTAETLASVLGTPPDYSVLPSDTPANARLLVRRCLEKDQKRRLQHIGDVRIEVEEALSALTVQATPGRPDRVSANRRLRRATGAIALASLAGVAGWFLAHRSPSTTPGVVVRLSIPSLGPPSVGPVGQRNVAISTDGSRVAYTSANRLWIRRMGQREALAIEVAAENPFFSPNGEWVGFFGQAGGETGLKKVPANGGVPVSLVATSQRSGGGTWRADGTIVFATSEGLYQVSENGGEPRLLVKPDPRRKERAYAWPEFLPDGRSVLFTMVPEDSIEGAQIAALDLKTLEARIVLKGGSAARYASTGHLVYASGQTLKAIAFDPDTKQTRGDPVTLPNIEIATALDNGAAKFAVSETGTLLFIAPNVSDQSLRTLSWVDRQGKQEPLPLEPGRYAYPRISPDGTRVALDIGAGGANRDIWIWNLERRSLTKLTDGPTEDMTPLWSRDGRRVFFASDRTGNFDVYSQAADGATEARVEFAGPGFQVPQAFTPDGTRLLVFENFKVLSVLNLARPDRLEPLLHGEFEVRLGVVSPDGNWIAYESNESGGRSEIFLRAFPNVNGRREKISIDGGRYPQWGPKDSGELFYVDLNGGMMAASVKLSPTLSLGSLKTLFNWEKPPPGPSGRPYDISPVDGRFLFTRRATEGSAGANDISVVLNWFEELRERVPLRGR
jgi:serine/threonine-protein kinase